MNSRLSRYGFVVGLLVAVLVGELANRVFHFGIPGIFFGVVVFISFGAYGLIGCLLLTFRKVDPGPVWGHSALAAVLLGVGFSSWGIGIGLNHAGFLGADGLWPLDSVEKLVIVAGIVLETRARLRTNRSDSAIPSIE